MSAECTGRNLQVAGVQVAGCRAAGCSKKLAATYRAAGPRDGKSGNDDAAGSRIAVHRMSTPGRRRPAAAGAGGRAQAAGAMRGGRAARHRLAGPWTARAAR